MNGVEGRYRGSDNPVALVYGVHDGEIESAE